MSTHIAINADQTLTVTWKGRKGRGSLFQMAAERNAEFVNVLSAVELWAVIMAVKSCPFPLGCGREVYKRVLDFLKTDPTKVWDDGLPEMELGKLRLAVVQRAGGGFNAPHDTYLKIAAEIAKESSPEPSPEPAQADFEITYRRASKCRFAVVEGTGQTREVVSWHRTASAAEKAHGKWKAPAQVVCLDRETGAVWHPAP